MSMRIVKLPCGIEVVEVPDQVPDHQVVEWACMGKCRFMVSCGRFWDWLNENHDLLPIPVISLTPVNTCWHPVSTLLAPIEGNRRGVEGNWSRIEQV